MASLRNTGTGQLHNRNPVGTQPCPDGLFCYRPPGYAPMGLPSQQHPHHEGSLGKASVHLSQLYRSTDYESVFFWHRHALDFSLSDTDNRQFLPDSHRRNTSGKAKKHRFQTIPIVQPIYLTYRRNLV